MKLSGPQSGKEPEHVDGCGTISVKWMLKLKALCFHPLDRPWWLKDIATVEPGVRAEGSWYGLLARIWEYAYLLAPDRYLMHGFIVLTLLWDQPPLCFLTAGCAVRPYFLVSSHTRVMEIRQLKTLIPTDRPETLRHLYHLGHITGGVTQYADVLSWCTVLVLSTTVPSILDALVQSRRTLIDRTVNTYNIACSDPIRKPCKTVTPTPDKSRIVRSHPRPNPPPRQ